MNKKQILPELRRWQRLVLPLLFLFAFAHLQAQVTIGTAEKPATGSLLQLKNLTGITGKNANANKGLLLPRVNLSKKNELYPMFLVDGDNPASGPNSNYQTNKVALDKDHTGLVVYNLNEDFNEDLCLGLNNWNGTTWQCMMPPKPVEFTLLCENIAVEGLYFEGEELTQVPNETNGQVNRIKLTLTNIPSSAFGSTATFETNTVDGISFKGHAKLLTTTQVVYMEGTGIPTDHYDKEMTITTNSIVSSTACKATVVIVIPPQRLMTVGFKIYPNYVYNLGLLTNRKGAPTSATPGYNSGNDMITDLNNFGYYRNSIVKFSGFKNQPVTPTSGDQPNFLPSTAAAINSWTDDMRDIAALSTSDWQNMTATTLKNFLKGVVEVVDGKERVKVRKVDVFMIGHETTDYFRTNNASDKEKCQLLVDFVKAGGILMICSEQNTSNANFLNLFFEKTNITSKTGAGAGSLYKLGFNAANTSEDMREYYCADDDPIIVGPFENLLGKTWGEDASTTKYLENVPVEDIVIYSGANPGNTTAYPKNTVTIFRHKTYPFVFIGDGGFNSNEHRKYTGLTVCPFRLTDKTIGDATYNHYPTFRPNYGTSAGEAYNAVFTANAFAWCIQKADEFKQTTRKKK